MTGRDLAWRAAGAGIIAGAAAVDLGWAAAAGHRAVLGVPAFLLAIGGLVLLVQGRRVVRALRVERSRHRQLPIALYRRRRAGRAHLQ